MAWTLPGLIGRDPWKADEAYSFGMVYNILVHHDWVIPTVANEPFMEKPPIMYVTGAVFAKLLGWALPLPDAARGAVVFFNLLTFFALWRASRELNGDGPSWLTPVLFIGAVGLIHNQHMLMTDVALLTGFALGHWGLALSLRKPWSGGALAGTGIGLAFLAKGLLGPGLMGLTAMLLPAVSRSWRHRRWFSLMIGLGLALLPWVVIWPWLVYERSPRLFHEWFWVNNIGRFAGANAIGPENEPFFYFKLLFSHFALPAFPLALWAWIRLRRGWKDDPGWQLPLLSFAIMLGVLSLSADGRSLYAQPMLVPLSLVGARAVDWLDGWPAKTVSWSCVVVAVVGALGAWLAWAVLLIGPPEAIWAKIHAAVPNYVRGFHAGVFVAALLGTAAALGWLLRSNKPSGRHAVINWAVLIGFIYLVAMTLFLPLTDANMTYRYTFGELRGVIPRPYHCVASHGLLETHRAMLHYFADVETRRIEVNDRAMDECDLMIMVGNYRNNSNMGPPPRGRWEKLWEGRRGGRESFRLYRRLPDASPSPLNGTRVGVRAELMPALSFRPNATIPFQRPAPL